MSNLQPTSNKPLGTFIKALNEAVTPITKSRTYTAQITRETPAAFIFMIDQSGSMSNKLTFANQEMSKAEAVARIINKTFNELISRCTKNDGIRDYAYIALIGYGGKSDEEANFAWTGKLEGKSFVSISQLYEGHIGIGGRNQRKWIEPIAQHKTPMHNAFLKAKELVQQWIQQHQNKDIYPPTIINITDGAATDADEKTLLQTVSEIKQLATLDGSTLVFNIHITEKQERPPITFPTHRNQLPNDTYAQLLYDLSSELPEIYHSEIANYKNQDIATSYVGMAYNADIDILVRMLNVGTSTIK
jgi:hypothetical protein